MALPCDAALLCCLAQGRTINIRLKDTDLPWGRNVFVLSEVPKQPAHPHAPPAHPHAPPAHLPAVPLHACTLLDGRGAGGSSWPHARALNIYRSQTFSADSVNAYGTCHMSCDHLSRSTARLSSLTISPGHILTMSPHATFLPLRAVRRPLGMHARPVS